MCLKSLKLKDLHLPVDGIRLRDKPTAELLYVLRYLAYSSVKPPIEPRALGEEPWRGPVGYGQWSAYSSPGAMPQRH